MAEGSGRETRGAGVIKVVYSVISIAAPHSGPVVGQSLRDNTMDAQTIRERVEAIKAKRDALIRLLEQPDLGTLRIDVNQALEEMDDLLEEFDRTFPAG